MTDIAIKVQNLSKCYHIYDNPSDRLKQFVAPRLQSLVRQTPRKYFREFWALKDVSFEIKKGETVGIIGRNGSGKSTLLKMICGTLNPSSGNVQTNGRIAALLELGSGFNPQFTGRENIYMNASILGLSNEEIAARFSDIVAFADIGDFIEQPVKTYSSGMMVRLAFSVAIHIEPSILIVDEALAVGDIVFQMKCLDKMKEIQLLGTTILFVSHSLEQIKRFCVSAVWLDHGKVQQIGESNYVTDQYRDLSLRATAEVKINKPAPRAANNLSVPAMIRSVIVSATKIAPFEPISVRVTYCIGERPLPKLLLGVAIRDVKGAYIFGPNTYLDKVDIPNSQGTHVVEFAIERLPLLTGIFVIDVGLFTDGGLVRIDYLGAAAEINVVAEYFSEGLVYIDHQWRIISHG
jgi:ABC-type polysaccharide/polyol phosphate transport system ATPase subunit